MTELKCSPEQALLVTAMMGLTVFLAGLAAISAYDFILNLRASRVVRISRLPRKSNGQSR